jgi:TolB protein
MKKISVFVFLATLLLIMSGSKSRAEQTAETLITEPVNLSGEDNSDFGSIKFTFERDGFIWIYDGNNEKKLIEGIQHSVSPDGKKIAFTKNFPDGKRSIAIYDIANGKEEVLDYFTNENNYEPKFSPDGNKIIFNYWTGEDWKIGYAVLDKRIFRTMTGEGVYSPAWSTDGKYILYHDLNELFKADNNGKIVGRYSLNEISCSGSPGFSSASAFILSEKENKIYYDLETDVEIGYPFNFINGIFVFDLNSKKCSVISDKNIYAVNPVLMNDGRILFSGFNKNELKQVNEDEVHANYSIYMFDPVSNETKKIINNAFNPSIIN